MRKRFGISGAVAWLTVVLPVIAFSQGTSDRLTTLEDDHGYFPCMDCHSDQETNRTPRILEEEHFEPLEWEDENGETHLVPFGQKVAIGDLLGLDTGMSLADDNYRRIGKRLNIKQYMIDNELSPADSVWTLVHGGGNLWCLDCHNAEDRDRLTKMNGELLTFNQSQLLCGECHGPKLRDWALGIHGKTIGYWDPELDTKGETERFLCVKCHLSHNPSFPSFVPMAAPVPRIDPPGGGHHPADEETAHE